MIKYKFVRLIWKVIKILKCCSIFRQIVNLLLPQFENEEFYWSDIESVKVISGMMMSGIVLRTRGGEYSMKNVSSADAAGFAAFTTSHLQQLKSS